MSAASTTTGTRSAETSVAMRNGTLKSGSSGAWGASSSRAERTSVASRHVLPGQAPPGRPFACFRILRDRAELHGVLARRARVITQLAGQLDYLPKHER